MNFDIQTKDFPETFYTFIEIPAGSNLKYEFDEELRGIKLDRAIFASITYPANYGFILKTKGKDGDPMDVLVYSSVSVAPGTIVKCRAVGIAEMEDEESSDNKIIAVPVDKVDPQSGQIKSISDVPEYIKERIKHFFEHCKELEKGRFVKFLGFKGKEEAIKQLEESKL